MEKFLPAGLDRFLRTHPVWLGMLTLLLLIGVWILLYAASGPAIVVYEGF